MVKKTLPNAILTSYLILVIVNLIWAAAGPIIKLTLQYIPPNTFLFFRFLLVCLLLLPFTWLELKKTKVYVQDYWKIFLLGLFSQSALIFLFIGLNYTTAVDAAIIGAIGVLMSVVAGHYFYYEKLDIKIKMGLGLAIVGTFIVILEPMLMGQRVATDISIKSRVFGNFLVLFNHLTFLIYIIWSKISLGDTTKVIKKTMSFIHIKPMKGKYSPALLTALTFFVGLTTMLPLAILENLNIFGTVTYDITALPADALVGILYMAIFSSIVAYFLFEWSLKFVSVSDTAILGYLSSIFGIPFAYLILAEVPTKYGLIGAGFIAVGVIIAEISAHAIRVNKNKSWVMKLVRKWNR